MNKFKSLLVAVVLFIGATSFMNAQSKIAHIDTQALVDAMPEMKSAQNQLEKLQKTYDTELKSMAKELDTKVKQYEMESESKTDKENQKRVQEVTGMQNNVQQYRQQALEKLQDKRVDVFKPILEKARVAIQKVARAQGFQYVLDSANGNGVILADGKDLMPEVKKEMGI